MSDPERPDLHLLDSVPPVSDSVPSAEVEPEGDAPEADEVLTVVELRFVDAIASGASLEDAATATGRSTRTLRRWKKRPEIVAAIKDRASEQVALGRAVLAAGMGRASHALVAMADGTEEAESARVSACRAVVEGASKLLEIDGMVARLAQLETRLEVSRTENLTPAEMAARFMRATRIAQEVLAAEADPPKAIDAIEVGAQTAAPAVPPGPATIEAVPAPVLSSVPMSWAQPVQRRQHPSAQPQVGVIPSK